MKINEKEFNKVLKRREQDKEETLWEFETITTSNYIVELIKDHLMFDENIWEISG